MATRESMVDESRNSAIVRDVDSALAEAYGIEKLDEALRVIAEQGRLMIGAHQAALSYIPDGNFKVAVHAIALSDKYEKYRSYDVMPTGEGIWALIIEQKVGVCLTQEELIRHPGWKNFSDLKDARAIEHPPLRGWLAVPILARRGDFVGLLQLSDKYEGEFTQEDLDLLTHLAKLVAPTLELQSVNKELQDRTKDLRNSEERFRAAFEQAAVGIAHVAPDGKFLRVNQKLSEIVGYPPDELMTRTFQEITYPEDLDADLENVRRVLDGDIETYSMDKRYYRKDKSLVWTNLTVALVRDDAGQPEYFISVIEDISRQKNAEEQLRSEGLLLMKLLDLQEQERQMVAHDIHDGFVQDVIGAHMHLQSIHGAVDPAKTESSVALADALLQNAIAEGRRLIRDLRPMVLDESGVIEAIVHLIADKQKNEGLTVTFAHDVIFDRLDTRLEGALFRIVQEALNNVTHHGQVNHADVQITQTNGMLQLVVRDRGVGFNPEQVSPDRFGLRGIRERARLFGGTATIESVPAEGTTVTVQLPLNVTRGRQHVP